MTTLKPASAPPVVRELRRMAEAIPRSSEHAVVMARLRAERAAEIAAAAVQADPTLTDQDRRWDLDVLAEVFRQLKPLARQVDVLMQRQALVAAAADESEIARLGRTNPNAPDDLDALSNRALEIAARIKESAVPEWTPQMVRERSESLLPSDNRLKEIADQLRYAIKDALALPYPAEEAARLAALADQIAPGDTA